jgi:hypothetical protein
MAAGAVERAASCEAASSAAERRLVAGVCLVAVLWCLATLTFVLARSAIDGLHFAGPYAAYFPGDQLRYLAWIRDAGLHGLIADPFRAGAAHVYLQPVFLISGLLWRAGLSVQLAYLLWTPVALGALIWGYASFTGRFLSGRERTAALALALLFFSPLVPLFDYGGIVNADGAFQLAIAAGHGAAYWQAWGFLPTVIALGLMPVFVLGVVEPSPSRAALTRTALAGLLAGWLHPWGGLELVLIAVGLLVIRRRRSGALRLALAAAAAGLPLIYYAALASVDPAWSLSRLRGGTAGAVWPLLVAYLPALVVALPAFRPSSRAPEPSSRAPERSSRAPDRSSRAPDRVLLLWIGAVFVTYLAPWGTRGASLEGVSLPLSVLAVKGWREWRPARGWAWLAVVLAIVPGAFYSAHTFRDLLYSHDYPYALSSGEQRAVDSLQADRARVLATPYLAGALPALAGLLDGQVQPPSGLVFSHRVDQSAASRLIRRDGISVVVADCLAARPYLPRLLAPLGFRAIRYGCARVYRRGPASDRPGR